MTLPVRFGILGAARIGPNALIAPARSHPDVTVTAVACRDPARGAEYAKKHGLSRTFSGSDAYQQLISNGDIDAVYIALPNGLHFEWAMRALQAGKHVLIEKPMTNTADEARQVFALAEKKGLVALEAIHCTFHPALQRVRTIVTGGELGKVKHVQCNFAVPSALSSLLFKKDDVRYDFDLGGGCMMDMGVYPIAALRFMTGTDTAPLTVASATATGQALDPTRIDRGMCTTFTFPGSDATAETMVDFSAPGWGPCGVLPRAFKIELTITLERGEIYVYNFVAPGSFHYIRVKRAKGFGFARYEQAYRLADGSGNKSWDSYRYQLEAFVDKVRGRKPAFWPEPQTVVTCLETIESVYKKAGMPPRPASSYKPEAEA